MKCTGESYFHVSATRSKPFSPTSVSERSDGAMMLHVMRAMIPPSNSTHATA